MATTFYSQIGANRRNSFFLSAIVVGLLALMGATIGYAVTGSAAGAVWLTVGAVVVGSLLSVGAYFSGDKAVLAVSGARPVTVETQPQLMNVVQELAIAANIPMPAVYTIDDTAPNAFATGRDPKHASVAVTTGLLEKLDREELQGVIGHELSHVRNYDIRYAVIVAALVGSIALLSDGFLRYSFWFGGGRRVVEQRSQWRRARCHRRDPRHRPGHHRPDHQPVRPACREPTARISGGRVLGRADPEPPWSRAGAREDRVRHGGPRGRQPGHPAHVLHEPDQAVRGALARAVLDPSGHRRPHRPPPRADRREPVEPVRGAAVEWPRLMLAGPPARVRQEPPVLDWRAGPVVSSGPPTGRRRPGDKRAEIAQLVEHATENRGVASSILALGTITGRGGRHRAEVAQLVEHHLAKVRVAGSSPVFRSTPSLSEEQDHRCPFV